MAISRNLCQGLRICLRVNRALTNTSDKVVWNTNMIESFNIIIFNICDHTLLTILIYDDSLIFSCDASSYGAGSELSLERGELELLEHFTPINFYPGRQDIMRQNWKVLALLCDFGFNFLNPWSKLGYVLKFAS